MLKNPKVANNNTFATAPAKKTTSVRSTTTRTSNNASTRKTPVKKQVAAKAPAKKKEGMLEEKHIASDAYFYSDPKGRYYITMRGHLVQVSDDNIFMVGRLAQSNKEGYSLMLSDKHYNYLYIGDGGNIYNGNDKKVGYLKIR